MSKLKNKQWTQIGFKGEWAQTLHKFLTKQQDSIPPGWITADKVLKKMGLSATMSSQRNKLLDRMSREGFIQKKAFRVFDTTGRRITSILHYKLGKPL
jgi:hypothetical protein